MPTWLLVLAMYLVVGLLTILVTHAASYDRGGSVGAVVVSLLFWPVVWFALLVDWFH